METLPWTLAKKPFGQKSLGSAVVDGDDVLICVSLLCVCVCVCVCVIVHRTMLDLESLAFEAQGHLMSNKVRLHFDSFWLDQAVHDAGHDLTGMQTSS